MKKIVLCLGLLCLSAGAFAGTYSDFSKYATADSLKPFARDMGGLIGSGLFSTGRSLGFSGFDVGVRAAAQFSPSSDNTILKNSGVNMLWLPWIQAEIGMPFRLDGFIRATNYEGLTMSGGGIRWGITKVDDEPYALQSMLVVAGHSAVNRSFSITHFSGNFVTSMKLSQVVTPYIGVGFDHTRLMVMESSADPSLVGSDVTVNDYRATVGMHFKIIRFGYLNTAFNMLHGQPALEGSLGVRF
ncbi:MAG: hypothetical protein WCS77_02270 [Elusimicrobiaceae bacterium]|jgi:hypothetical protein